MQLNMDDKLLNTNLSKNSTTTMLTLATFCHYICNIHVLNNHFSNATEGIGLFELGISCMDNVVNPVRIT